MRPVKSLFATVWAAAAVAALVIASLVSSANAEFGLGNPVHDTAARPPAYSDMRHDLHRPSFANYAGPVVAAQSLTENNSVQDHHSQPASTSPAAHDTTGEVARFASFNVLLAFAVAAVGMATVASLVVLLQRRRQRLIHHQQIAQSDLELAAADAFAHSEKEVQRMLTESQLATIRRAQAEALMLC